MDFINKIICGHCIDVLKELPTGSFNCVITSPPYWGLRAYQSIPQIWGGKKDCQHKWGFEQIKTVQPRPDHSGNILKTTRGKQPSTKARGFKTSQGQFCQLCGAWRGEHGSEPTPELYIKHSMLVFNEVKRVLRKDGILFVNLGDTYGTHTSKRTGQPKLGIDINSPANEIFLQKRPNVGLEKSLCAIPERFVLAMMERGWIFRWKNPWVKGMSFAKHICNHCKKETQYSGSCMPDSAQDRPNKNGFEHIYVFTKNTKTKFWTHERKLRISAKKPKPNYIYTHKNTEQEYDYPPPISNKKLFKKLWTRTNLWQGHDYYYEQQYEDLQESSIKRYALANQRNTESFRNTKDFAGGGRAPNENPPRIYKAGQGTVKSRGQNPDHLVVGGNNPLGRTIRNVWAINPQSYKDAHYATFPEELVRPMIKMGCPEFVCKKCGMPRVKVYENETVYRKRPNAHVKYKNGGPSGQPDQTKAGVARKNYQYTDCGCNAGWRPGVCLDPFRRLRDGRQGGRPEKAGLYDYRIAA